MCWGWVGTGIPMVLGRRKVQSAVFLVSEGFCFSIQLLCSGRWDGWKDCRDSGNQRSLPVSWLFVICFCCKKKSLFLFLYTLYVFFFKFSCHVIVYLFFFRTYSTLPISPPMRGLRPKSKVFELIFVQRYRQEWGELLLCYSGWEFVSVKKKF